MSGRSVLRAWSVAVPAGLRLPGRTCARHLTLLGAARRPAADGLSGPGGAGDCLALEAGPGEPVEEGDPLTCAIPWCPPPDARTAGLGTGGGELIVQAISGLMGVHGRSSGRPARIGLEICSVAAGTIASAGLLAASIASRRGRRVRLVETSALDAALCFLRHHLAIATCADGPPAELMRAGPGLPFTTADGHLVEIDTVSPGRWCDFWLALGADRRDVDRGWLPFAFRYNLATCSLPPGLCAVASRRTLGQLMAAATPGQLEVRRLRGYAEVIADADLRGNGGERAPWDLAGERSSAAPLPGCQGADGLPLAGLRVVEVTSRVQGSLAGLLLQMLGAEVVKVEPPGGDPARLVAPLAGSDGATFVAYNAGKHAVEIDYWSPDGRAELEEMLADADVFLHNWPPGRAERVGLDHPALARRNPSLVHCHAAGWPERGSEPEALGTDALVQAHLGFGHGINPPGEPPLTSKVTIVDVLGGLAACEGVLAGLHLRATTGRGARVRTSLVSAAMAAQEHVLEMLAAGRERRRRLGRPLLGAVDRPLETASGYLAVAVDGDRELTELCRVCGTGPDGVQRRMRDRAAGEWEEELSAAGLRAAVVRTDLAGLWSDPVVSALLVPAGGGCLLPRSPWRFTS